MHKGYSSGSSSMNCCLQITREHNVSGHYRLCGFESQAGHLKLLIVFRMRR